MKSVSQRSRVLAVLIAALILFSVSVFPISAMTPADDSILAEAVYGVPEKIDGVLDDGWSNAKKYKNERTVDDPRNATELEVNWRVMYDNIYLYFFVEVIDYTIGDAEFEYDAWGNYYAKNSLHMMFDMGYERETSYDSNDFYIDISCRGYFNGRGAGTQQIIKHAVVVTEDGYNVEVRVDHSGFAEFKAEKDTCFGFDLWGNDCLAPITGRLYNVTWSDTADASWRDASLMGTIRLGPVPADVTPTEREEVKVDRYPGIEDQTVNLLLNGTELRDLGAIFEPMTNLINPQGGGNKDISCIIDGVPGKSDGEQYDSYLAEITDEYDPWYGVNFDKPYMVDSVVFWEGGHWNNGGWFGATPKLQLLKDGEWYDYKQTITPEYREDSAEKQLPKFAPFIFDLSQPVICDGVRVIGPGNQFGTNVSCSEIEVWGYEKNASVAHDTLDGKTPVEPETEPPVTVAPDTEPEETVPGDVETGPETDVPVSDEAPVTNKPAETSAVPAETEITTAPSGGSFPWWIPVIAAAVVGVVAAVILGLKKKK